MRLGPARWACGRAAVTAAALGFAAFCGALCAACGPADTGILLEVTATSIHPDRLSFVIAGQVTTTQGTRFIQDPDIAVLATLNGRDLASDPYRLLIHDGLGGSLQMSAVVLAYSSDTLVGFAGLGPTAFVSDKLLLYRLELAAPDGVEMTGTGCVTWSDSGTSRTIAVPEDHDCDDHRTTSVDGGDDCDDENPDVNPDVTEVCGNGIDDNCNDQIDESPDDDGDGVHLCDGDCDDHDPDVHPGAVEVCDGKDNDCNGKCDDGFDADGDGYTVCGSRIRPDGTCRPAAVDCNDNDPTIHPGAAEVCDGKDNDCNGLCDDGATIDVDGDGFTSCGTLAGLVPGPGGICGAPTSALADCHDEGASSTAPMIFPFAHEICDGKDDNCDGTLETEEPCYGGIPGPGNACGLGLRACQDSGTDNVGLQGNCQPSLAAPLFVDMALCDAYDDGSVCKNDPEPWRCASETAALATLDCTVSYKRALGTVTDPPTATVCPNSHVAAPTLSATAPGCAYTLIGGTTQEGYQVGLRALGSSGAPTAGHLGCDAELAVSGATNPYAPQPDEWMMAFDDTATLEPAGILVFHVTPALVAACPAVPMSCTMRTP
jgi:Putative metal-binding motif